MALFSKSILSGSTNGRPVLVAATSSPGTLIHTGSTNTNVLHEVWLYASNPDTVQRTLTIQWGGTTTPNDLITLFLPAQSGLTVVAPGLLIKGAGTALEIRAFADSASKVTVTGYVNVIA